MLEGTKRLQSSSRHSKQQMFERKPPIGNWRPAIPSWEEFYRPVGSVPRRKLVEAKRYMHLHDKMLKWNDSEVEEAFHDAKERFWAETNGIPCSIALPNPNLNIDAVDWASKVDPELLCDLERGPKALDGGNYSGMTFFSDVLANQWMSAQEDPNRKDDHKLETDLNIVRDNWETCDWDDLNGELKPARPYFSRHKSSGFCRDDCGKGLKQN